MELAKSWMSPPVLLVSLLALGHVAANTDNCNYIGSPCCEGDAGELGFCKPDSDGIETVCLNTGLNGEPDTPTCHKCGHKSDAPCCAPYPGNEYPRCVHRATQCFEFIVTGTDFEPYKLLMEDGYQGICECDEVSVPNPETGVCENLCGAAHGSPCCVPEDGGEEYCDTDPLGDPLVCLNQERFDGARMCVHCGWEPGMPCCKPGTGSTLPDDYECRCGPDDCECVPDSGLGWLAGEDACQLPGTPPATSPSTPLPSPGGLYGIYGEYGAHEGIYGI